ncbi:hypothetical protein EsH8_I_000153 [Colletotrichum jinshuiense]
MKANVIAATIFAAFSAGVFAQEQQGELPTGIPSGFPTGAFPTGGERPTQVPGAAKPSGGFGGGFPGGFPSGLPSGFPSGFGGVRPTQVPGAAQPSGGFGGNFPGFNHGDKSGFQTRTRGSSEEAAGFGAQAVETGAPTGVQSGGARPTGKGKGKGKNHGTGALPSGVRPTQVPGAAKPSGGFGGNFPDFGGERPTGSFSGAPGPKPTASA